MKASDLMIGDWVVYNGDVEYTDPSPLNASAQTLNSSDMQSNRCLFRLVPNVVFLHRKQKNGKD